MTDSLVAGLRAGKDTLMAGAALTAQPFKLAFQKVGEVVRRGGGGGDKERAGAVPGAGEERDRKAGAS